MRLTYDKRAGVAHLRLRSNEDDVGTVSSQSVELPGADGADDCIVLDFDQAGRLVGVEFLTPAKRLLPGVLAAAETDNS
jgi:uncharacterized protein YuzE